jgi:sulfur-oxidizing protein SoxY
MRVPVSLLYVLTISIAAAFSLASSAQAEDDPWPDIRAAVFDDRPISEDDNAIALYAPEHAEDAAIVPIAMHLPPSVANAAKSLTLIVDRNPAPVAATFKFGDGFRANPALGERKLTTRIRIDNFSNVRAVLETSDGKLHMATVFIRGAGGCSAPASKDMDEAMASLGRVRVKTSANPIFGDDWREGVIMIRHPNFTGMQMDVKSRGYTPARFVNEIEVKRGDDVVLRMEGGISISEDPNIRFNYEAAESDVLYVRATDTEGAEFSAKSDPAGT